jgi:hypothetical protein
MGKGSSERPIALQLVNDVKAPPCSNVKTAIPFLFQILKIKIKFD